MAYPSGMGGPSGLRSPPSLHQAMGPTNDGRAQLHRRFTTNNIPTLSTPLSPIGQQRRQAAEPAEFTTAVCRHSLCGTMGSWRSASRAMGAMTAPPPCLVGREMHDMCLLLSPHVGLLAVLFTSNVCAVSNSDND
ncbi:hypothetical protein T440DRAFT_208598 [Plenodomus tracheiphilus IPT5]|uniref:Uncharacterized protein n=1 Tax=Plenodomus tracheiphilus IPT5 TaxID=1408161 RepID=A0A6A7BLG0_9PLEO|nr:hypothetical protein T440DRAFT_208598 [Plenodomus tracheiphilus IPT5]